MSIASEREDRMRVAKTILEQLGGNHFRMMTGAKNLAGDENSLSMRIGRNSSNSKEPLIVLLLQLHICTVSQEHLFQHIQFDIYPCYF